MAPPALFAYAVLVFFAAFTELVAEPAQQSVSTSRQFIVYGTNLETRGVICDLAELTKRELLDSLGQPDTWATAIIINTRYPQANLPEIPRLNLDLAQTGFGLKFQLDLVIDRTVSRPEVRRELLRALILEMAYRGEQQLPSGAKYVSPPEWLLEGIPSEQSERSRERVAALLAASATSRTVWPLRKFLTQPVEQLNGVGRTIYCAHSFALVDLLSRGADGPRRLAQFILDLPRGSEDPMDDLRKHFPEVFGTESAEMTWQKQIAHLVKNQPYQLLSIAETERQLGETLQFTISDRGRQTRYDIAQFSVFLRQKAAQRALSELSTRLTTLGLRAHPVYAQIIAEYVHLVVSIQRGRTLAVAKRLDQLASARRALAARSGAIDDYLNWFEATSLARPSGQFADYMKAAERAAQPKRTKKDPISVYLDALESQLEQEKASIR
jgi:hypothetical protein